MKLSFSSNNKNNRNEESNFKISSNQRLINNSSSKATDDLYNKSIYINKNMLNLPNLNISKFQSNIKFKIKLPKVNLYKKSTPFNAKETMKIKHLSGKSIFTNSIVDNALGRVFTTLENNETKRKKNNNNIVDSNRNNNHKNDNFNASIINIIQKNEDYENPEIKAEVDENNIRNFLSENYEDEAFHRLNTYSTLSNNMDEEKSKISVFKKVLKFEIIKNKKYKHKRNLTNINYSEFENVEKMAYKNNKSNSRHINKLRLHLRSPKIKYLITKEDLNFENDDFNSKLMLSEMLDTDNISNTNNKNSISPSPNSDYERKKSRNIIIGNHKNEPKFNYSSKIYTLNPNENKNAPYHNFSHDNNGLSENSKILNLNDFIIQGSSPKWFENNKNIIPKNYIKNNISRSNNKNYNLSSIYNSNNIRTQKNVESANPRLSLEIPYSTSNGNLMNKKSEEIQLSIGSGEVNSLNKILSPLNNSSLNLLVSDSNLVEEYLKQDILIPHSIEKNFKINSEDSFKNKKNSKFVKNYSANEKLKNNQKKAKNNLKNIFIKYSKEIEM